MDNKKGILGLDTVKIVMLSLLVLTVIGIAITLSLISLRDVVEKTDVVEEGVTYIETTTLVNSTTAVYITGVTGGTRGCSLSGGNFTNSTRFLIDPANYTIANCTVIALTAGMGSGDLNNTVWNYSGTVKYARPDTYNTERNITRGVTGFFSNTGTFFAILVVVVIIALIAIVIMVVTRLGGGGGITSGGGREFGSDTVMGI